MNITEGIVNRPDYLFEVSWEVCNKVGGIHTVVASKALLLGKAYGGSHILIGPDVWRETTQNPEFTEDKQLFATWRSYAASQGLRVRIGHWNIPGSPAVILVDYTTFISSKDSIFADFWEKFKLDSISGNWEYIDSALFGYAAGKVIESFVKFRLEPSQSVVAHFHEWMTGAGILYLKSRNLAIGTVFTTHATVVGRCISCNNLPLYSQFDSYNGDEMARRFNVTARHSLEKCAANNADVFTTVSDITAREAMQFLGRMPSIITPNGFENSIVPAPQEYDRKRSEARKLLLKVASAMHGVDYPMDALLIGISGRYEYKNKGIDLFLEAVARIKEEGYRGKKIVAFVMIPAGNNGADRELVEKMEGHRSTYTTATTHYLSWPENDAILKRIGGMAIDPKVDDITVVYIPSYLNGNDGIFNTTYYNLLIGLDLTIFPSYYEPWGYTPMESLAFKVPTVTTSLAGFGEWVMDHYEGSKQGIEVLQRDEDNFNIVVDGIVARIGEIASLDEKERKFYKENASDISKIALWENHIKYYNQAYLMALDSVEGRDREFPHFEGEKDPGQFGYYKANSPAWRSIMINKQLPDRLKHLDTLSKNLWWCWNHEAIDLFESISPELWELSGRNPIALLDMVTLQRYKELENSGEFTQRLDSVYKLFTDYMAEKEKAKGPSVAYFCMEYGLDTSLKIYSGGLGILAGDYLKEASDMNVRMTAVGLLYKYGYFTQKLSSQGDQVAEYDPQDFSKTPAQPVLDADGQWVLVPIAFPGRNVYAKLWRVDVGRVELYLLDTDIEQNLPEDRVITHQLYGGDWENRLKQELLLGFAGVRALRRLSIHADVYHCNEGHAAFIGLERMREYVQNKDLSATQALEVVRASSLFTTHTPVPAGHDAFSEDMLRRYLAQFPERLKMDWTSMMALGKLNANNPGEKFSMSYLAANLSQEINGVSWLHGVVSRDILAPMWPGYLPEELHVSYVTNGVHYPTWTAPEWKKIHAKVFGPEFATHHYDKDCFQGFRKVSAEEIWETRTKLKTRLIEKIKRDFAANASSNYYSPQQIVKINNTLRDDVLTIGFARRFATYKRAYLLFKDLERLDKIVNSPDHPVQFLFAGKAHPADKGGQNLIKRIVEISKMPQFIGKIIFVPNYDITIAKYLVQGVDVWMNNPTRPLEASGTSGEKAVMNGVMHFSVLDGWWVEGYKEGAGWALQMERTYDNQDFQDELDSATIYNIIEGEIAPLYYDKDKKGISLDWINVIKNCVAEVACNFTTNRMMEDYLRQYYHPLAERKAKLVADNYAEAREIAAWKRRLRRDWNSIEVVSSNVDTIGATLLLGKEYKAEIVLNIGDMNPNDLALEVLLASPNKKGRIVIRESFEFKLKECVNGRASYECTIIPDMTGTYSIAARLYATNSKLPHRQDFELVKWL